MTFIMIHDLLIESRLSQACARRSRESSSVSFLKKKEEDEWSSCNQSIFLSEAVLPDGDKRLESAKSTLHGVVDFFKDSNEKKRKCCENDECKISGASVHEPLLLR
jgi:hypothetical protein